MDDGDYVIKVKAVVRANKKVKFEVIENHGKGKEPLISYKEGIEQGLIDAYYERKEISVRIKDNVVIQIL